METKNPKKTDHKRKKEEGNHTIRRKRAYLILAVLGLALGMLGVWRYRGYVREKEALESARLQEKWESGLRAAEKPAQTALKALEAWVEVKSRTRNEELVRMLPPAGIQEFLQETNIFSLKKHSV